VPEAGVPIPDAIAALPDTTPPAPLDAGTAVCAPGTTRCGDRCTDLASDPSNCGACGVACAPESTCAAGGCATPTPVVGAGAACVRDADCPSLDGLNPGYCISEGEGARGGYCTGPCMLDSNCGAGGLCAGAPMGSHAPVWPARCVRACGATICRRGYVCGAASTSGPACVPDCRLNVGVCGGARCDEASGLCRGECASDADCSLGSACVMGACRCGPGTACMPGNACNPSNGGYCGCTTDAVCGEGHVCPPNAFWCFQ
jgi:hypothetical protein